MNVNDPKILAWLDTDYGRRWLNATHPPFRGGKFGVDTWFTFKLDMPPDSEYYCWEKVDGMHWWPSEAAIEIDARSHP